MHYLNAPFPPYHIFLTLIVRTYDSARENALRQKIRYFTNCKYPFPPNVVCSAGRCLEIQFTKKGPIVPTVRGTFFFTVLTKNLSFYYLPTHLSAEHVRRKSEFALFKCAFVRKFLFIRLRFFDCAQNDDYVLVVLLSGA